MYRVIEGGIKGRRVVGTVTIKGRVGGGVVIKNRRVGGSRILVLVQDFRPFDELIDERHVWRDAWAFFFNPLVSLVNAPIVSLHYVGDEKGCGSRDSALAMNEDFFTLFGLVMDEIGQVFQVLGYCRVVIPRDINVVWNVGVVFGEIGSGEKLGWFMRG